MEKIEEHNISVISAINFFPVLDAKRSCNFYNDVHIKLLFTIRDSNKISEERALLQVSERLTPAFISPFVGRLLKSEPGHLLEKVLHRI